MVNPHFTMLWSHSIPEHQLADEDGRKTRVVTVAGGLAGRTPPPPPPDSWASRPDSNVAIWTITLEPRARFTLPAAAAGTRRTIYFFRGERLRLAGEEQISHAGLEVKADREILLENGPSESELLMLQGRPIAEPVVQHGPFVMNTRQEILQAFADFQQTQFGGWPWPSDGPVHPRDEGRFAIHADGRAERPE
jgi:hypothetical protein